MKAWDDWTKTAQQNADNWVSNKYSQALLINI